jgi:hypothetical protein
VGAFDFQAAQAPILFDQASKTVIPFSYKDSSGVIVPLALYGARMTFFVDESAALLTLSVGNGKIVVGNTDPNLTATILATDTAMGTPISGYPSGRWYLYLDPNGVEDGASFKLIGGGYTMTPLGPAT